MKTLSLSANLGQLTETPSGGRYWSQQLDQVTMLTRISSTTLRLPWALRRPLKHISTNHIFNLLRLQYRQIARPSVARLQEVNQGSPTVAPALALLSVPWPKAYARIIRRPERAAYFSPRRARDRISPQGVRRLAHRPPAGTKG